MKTPEQIESTRLQFIASYREAVARDQLDFAHGIAAAYRWVFGEEMP